jgi:hypothetical protein
MLFGDVCRRMQQFRGGRADASKDHDFVRSGQGDLDGTLGGLVIQDVMQRLMFGCLVPVDNYVFDLHFVTPCVLLIKTHYHMVSWNASTECGFFTQGRACIPWIRVGIQWNRPGCLVARGTQADKRNPCKVYPLLQISTHSRRHYEEHRIMLAT